MRLDLGKVANSFQKEGPGMLPVDPYHRNTEHKIIYVYIYKHEALLGI
jgi:hypothetical protein